MGSRIVFTVVSAVIILSLVPSGRCFVTDLIESISKTSAKARDSVADVGNAGINTVMAGTRGLHRMVKFATDTIYDYHGNTMESMVNGHKRAGELLDDGVDSLVDMGKRIGVKVRDDTVSGSMKATRYGVDFAKSGVDILNKASTGTTNTLRTAMEESSGRALNAMPLIPIVTPLLHLPHNAVYTTLGALSDMSEDAAARTKSILDKFRPKVDDKDED